MPIFYEGLLCPGTARRPSEKIQSIPGDLAKNVQQCLETSNKVNEDVLRNPRDLPENVPESTQELHSEMLELSGVFPRS